MQPIKCLLGAMATIALSTLAAAENTAGSLLLFPEFNNNFGVHNLYTITNTSADSDVLVEIVYIDGDDCLEFNREISLTPNDTFSLLTKFHNPEQVRGYAYAFAKDAETGEPIVFNWLVGSSIMVDFLTINSAVNPFVYAGIGSDGDVTDADGDGNRDLDGLEYEAAADEIIIPRFIGQGLISSHSLLTLIALTGGSQFSTTVDFLIYNDNEEGFSSEYTFECWDKVALGEISGVFSNNFLADSTNNDPNETFGIPVLQTGWILMDGALASSNTTSIPDPAFLAVLSEGLRGLRGADLPFQRGTQSNASLLPHDLSGQN